MKKKKMKVKRKKQIKKTIKKIAIGGVSKYRKILFKQREELMNEVRKRIKTGQEETRAEVMDAADQATDSYESELLYGLSDSERKYLDDVSDALIRIDKGGFGICEICGKPINKARLEAIPSTKMCIKCQESTEKVTKT